MKARQLEQEPMVERPAKSARDGVLIALALVALTLGVYWQVGRFEFVNYDDTDYVSANAMVQRGLTWEGVKWAFTTGHASNWHPMTWLSHMLDCQLFGIKPAAHHFTNLLFHIVNTLLVFGILKRMTGAIWRSAFVAALFALHPLHVESVAWISERKDVLSTLLLLLTLFAYVSHVRKPAVWRYSLVGVLFALGLMAKPMLVTLPFVLLLLDYWPLRRIELSTFQALRSTLLRLALEKIPLFLLAGASCVATYFAQRGWGAIYPAAQLPVSARLANAAVSYVRYLGKMVWPEDLAVPYPYPGGWAAWQVVGATILLCGVSAAAVAMAKKRPYFLVGWLWYLGTLVPVIGIVQVGMQAMADRYTYVPFIGIFMAVAWGAKEATDPWRHQRVAVAIGGVAILAACMTLTWRQLLYWRNTEALFGHTVAVTKNNFMAHYNLANRFSTVGKLDEAVAHYEAALRARPDYANAHNNLGNVLDRLNRNSEAAQHYAAALQFGGGAAASVNVGNSFLTAGKIEEAIGHLTEALRLAPDSPEAHNSLGVALVRQNKPAEAAAHFRSALQVNPDFLDARANLAATLMQQRSGKEAIEQYELVLRANPKHFEAERNLGELFSEAGRMEEAIAHYRKARQLNPNHPGVGNGLGLALAMQGNMGEAAQEFSEAVRLDPKNAAVQGNLGNALAALGKRAEAIQCYEAALKLNPNDEQVHNNLANTLATEGRANEAAEHYAAALKLNPANHETQFNFSLLLVRTGKRDEAVAHLREALRLKPDYAAAQAQLKALTGN